MGSYVTYEVRDYGSGYVEWRLDGKIHRIGGPAVTHRDGSEFWYDKGLLHNVDGPAMVWTNGSKVWILHGEWLNERQHQAAVAAMNATKECVDKTISIDGVEYSLVRKQGNANR